jgi:uncharacterized protein DUF6498
VLRDGLKLDSYRGRRRGASLAALVGVNILPLLGVLLLDWDVAALMLLYWSENLLIGFYTLVKMLVQAPLAGLGSGAFFMIHYGGFCAVHGVFIMALLVDGDFEPFPAEPWPLFLVFPQLLFNVAGQVFGHASTEWLVTFFALFVSHGISFVMNFLIGPERDEVTVKNLMGAPYGRVVVLHIAIIFGGMAVMALGQPVFMLITLVLLKLGLDVGMHLRQHRKNSP